MPRILTLEKIPRKKGWFTLILDNAYSFVVNDELIIKHALRPERELTKPEIEQIKSEGEYLFLRAKAFDILSRRRVSEKELERKLKFTKIYGKHFPRVIANLKDLGLIDDSGYATSFIHTALIGGPKSKALIRRKLLQKGISEEIAQKAIEQELGDYDEKEAALTIAKKKYKSVKQLPTLKAKQRVADFLRSRGFSWSNINYCLAKLFKADED
jgi:regulatory protein